MAIGNFENANDFVKTVKKLPENVDLHSAVLKLHSFGHTLYEVG